MGKGLTRQMVATKTRLHLLTSPAQGGLQMSLTQPAHCDS